MAHNIVLNNFCKRTPSIIINHVQRRQMPVNVPPTATGKRRFRLEVETDPHKLVNYCCGLNYHIDEPPIKLKDDSEYPEWLWNLRLSPKKNSWEMEKGTKEYYLQLADEGRNRNYRLKMSNPKEQKIVGKVLKKQEEYIHRLRFAALAHMEDDAGLELDSMETDWWGDIRNIKKREYYLPKREGKELYMDKIEGNIGTKNFYADQDSSFSKCERSMKKRPNVNLPAIQDSKRRHRYASN